MCIMFMKVCPQKVPGLESEMPFAILGHFAQGIDDFLAKLCAFHDGLNLNKDVQEADGWIDHFS